MANYFYLYADESGNTGKNIFDEPRYFYQGALLCEEDSDDLFEGVISDHCKKYGVKRIHAKDNNEEINLYNALKAIEILDGYNWSFHLYSIEKPYISITTFVDMIFDSGLNHNVSPLWYNHEYYRHRLCCLCDDILTNKSRFNFWSGFLSGDFDKIINVLKDVKWRLRRFVSYSEDIYDVVLYGLVFAIHNIEDFQFSAHKKKGSYKLHTPNMIAFTTLFQAMHSFHLKYGSIPISVCHDEQGEFRKSMVNYTNEFGQFYIPERSDGLGGLIDTVPYNIGELCMPKSKDSCGLQMVDTFLWLLQRKGLSENPIVKKINKNVDLAGISRSISDLIVYAWMRRHRSR